MIGQVNDIMDKISGFPRKLTDVERNLLFCVLPDNKSGYKDYREKISKYFVIGYGRFRSLTGRTNLILGKQNDKPDTGPMPVPVFAFGTVKTDEQEIDISIHEETDEQIEIDIFPEKTNGLPDKINIKECWNYSEWMPGQNAPNDNSKVREVELIPGRFELVIAPAHKKIWLHNFETDVNHLIPVSNFFNELMSVKNIRNAEIVLKPNNFFSDHSDYSDHDLKSAFVKYNKYMRRFEINYNEIKFNLEKRSSGNFISKIFKRGKN